MCGPHISRNELPGNVRTTRSNLRYCENMEEPGIKIVIGGQPAVSPELHLHQLYSHSILANVRISLLDKFGQLLPSL